MKALLVHGHARLPFAPLDFGEPGFLLLLPNFQLLQHALVVSLHLLPLLRQQRDRYQRRRDTSGERESAEETKESWRADLGGEQRCPVTDISKGTRGEGSY